MAVARRIDEAWTVLGAALVAAGSFVAVLGLAAHCGCVATKKEDPEGPDHDRGTDGACLVGSSTVPKKTGPERDRLPRALPDTPTTQPYAP